MENLLWEEVQIIETDPEYKEMTWEKYDEQL